MSSSLWRAPTFRSRVARLHGTSPGCRYPSIRSCTPRTSGAGSTLRADSRACSPARSCGCGRQGNVSLHEGERQVSRVNGGPTDPAGFVCGLGRRPPDSRGRVANFDVRVGKEGHAVRNLLNPPSATLAHRVDLFTKIEAARQRLQWSIPGLSVETHPIHGVPEVITARGMFLTPPHPKADAELLVRHFLLATAPLYGLSQAGAGWL